MQSQPGLNVALAQTESVPARYQLPTVRDANSLLVQRELERVLQATPTPVTLWES